MKHMEHSRISVVLIWCILAVGLNASCIKRPFGRPPGEAIGSCRGDMRLADGGKTRFVFDLFNPNYSQTFSTRKKRVVSHCVPSPLDSLPHEWERAPLPTPGLRLPLAHRVGEGDWGVRVESEWKFMNRSG